MKTLFLRAVIAFLVLPGIVAFIVPLWLATLDDSLPAFNPFSLPILFAGATLLLWCVRDFYIAGRGTLAPWSPPTQLVIVGLYRFSRNPMYVAVVLILLGWAVAFHSVSHAAYAIVVGIGFHLRIVFHEEPWLKQQFGEDWVRYRASVPRWIGLRPPRMRTSA